jgi:hypothetical protein
MLSEVLRRPQLFSLLHKIDVDLAAFTRDSNCPFCGGPLHSASYVRKPRGGPPALSEEYCVRLSLCCGSEGCRRRTLPLSVLFWGRRVYWGAVILVVTGLLQQRTEGFCARRIEELFGVPRQTLTRWLTWFRDVFPKSELWQSLCGRFMLPVSTDSIPLVVFERLGLSRGDPEAVLVSCLRLLRFGLS